MGNNPNPDMQQVMELLNETCNQMAEKIRLQEMEIRRLKEGKGKGEESEPGEVKKFGVN